MVIKTQYPYLRVKSLLDRFMTHFHAYRPQLLCSSVSLKIGSYTVRFTLHKHFCCLKLAMHFMRSKNLTNKKQKIFSEKQKGFRDGLLYSSPQKSKETRGNAITQPRSHPITKFYIFLMGWDRGWVMAFPLFICFFEGWNMTAIPKSFLFFGENFLLLVYHRVDGLYM